MMVQIQRLCVGVHEEYSGAIWEDSSRSDFL